MTAYRFTVAACAVCMAASVVLPTSNAYAATRHVYYVSTSGNDSSAGSLSAPWKTIQRAANGVVAGDTVYVRAGIYNETIDVRTSGSAAAGTIVFSSYPGERASVSAVGKTVPKNDIRGVWNLSEVSYVTVQNFDIGYYSVTSKTEVPVGVYVSGAGSFVSILDNRVHDIVNKTETCPDGNAFGIEIYGSHAPASINNLTIDGNEVDHLRTGCSESLSFTGNVEKWVVSNNIVHDNDNIGIAITGFEDAAPNIGGVIYDQARNGSIIGNTVYNISSQGNGAYGNDDYSADGIYVEGGAQVIIDRNLVHHSDIGIEVTSETAKKFSSDVTVRNNVVMYSNSAGISLGGSDASNGGTSNATVVNNTLFENDTQNTGSGELQIQFHTVGTVFENNLVYANENGLAVNYWPTAKKNTGYAQPGVIDHNLYYAVGGVSNLNWVWAGASYSSLSSYRTKSGVDATTIAVDPLFISVGKGDLHLSGTSPARVAGLPLSTSVVGAADFAGNPRVVNGRIDLGAYQSP